jgi:hypothetical protein
MQGAAQAQQRSGLRMRMYMYPGCNSKIDSLFVTKMLAMALLEFDLN